MTVLNLETHRRRSAPPSPRKLGEVTAAKEEMTARLVLQDGLRLFPDDVRGQTAYFFRTFRIPAAKGRKRSVSAATETKYVEVMGAAITTLHECGIRPRNLNELTVKHLRRCMAEWEKQGLSASTLATRFSCLKRVFVEWLGKGAANIGSVSDFMKDPTRAKRAYSATSPKAWQALGIDTQLVLQEVQSLCPSTAMHLALCEAFGLRVQEALALRPEESDAGDQLTITRGSKGGRGRSIPIQSALQRQVLDLAKGMADPHTGYVRLKGYSLKRSRNHFYYVIRKAGVSKAALGITAHGLRHQHANDAFQAQTGTPAPVNGGGAIDRDIEMAARKNVTEQLGHSRTNVTTAYTGSVVHMRRYQRQAINALLDTLELPQGELAQWFLQQEAQQAQCGMDLALYVVGPQADGIPVPENVPLLLALAITKRGPISNAADAPETSASNVMHQLAPELQSLVAAQFGRLVFLQPEPLVPAEASRLELTFRQARSVRRVGH